MLCDYERGRMKDTDLYLCVSKLRPPRTPWANEMAGALSETVCSIEVAWSPFPSNKDELVNSDSRGEKKKQGHSNYFVPHFKS